MPSSSFSSLQIGAISLEISSMPGLTLALGEVDQFEDVMKTAEKAIRNFINEEPVGYKIYEMEHPDVLLWAVWACLLYTSTCE